MTTVITREQGYPGLSVEIIRITTTSTLAQVQTAGWFNNSPISGESISPVDVVLICYAFGSANQGTNFFTVTISAVGVVTFALAEANVVLPTIANHIATYTNIAGTLGEDPATAISGGNIQAGLSGTAGQLASFPATAANGSFIFKAINNTGGFNSTFSNSNIGQATVYSLPDPGSATANIILSKSAATQHITTGSLQVDAGNLIAGLATGGENALLQLFPTTTASGSLRLIAANNGGNFNVDITNASFGQATVITIPDPAAATAKPLISGAAVVSGNFPQFSGTAGLVVDSALAVSNVVAKNAANTFTGVGSIILPKVNGTEAANAVTASGVAGLITTSALTTAAGSAYSITWTNTVITATSVVLLSVSGGTNTRETLFLTCAPGSGTATLVINNIGPTNALNGTLLISYLVI